MDRKEAIKLMESKVKNKNLRKHMLAAEAIMRALARRYNQNEELWGLAGLLHDLDYDKTAKDPKAHSMVAAEMLQEQGFPEEMIYAVKVHNDAHNLPRRTLLDKALYAVDPLTGLIVASALIHPEKKLSAIDPQFVMNRYKEKGFARGANREQIASCRDFDLSLEEFITIGLEAMQEIAEDLGL